jgi:hypothetical protein
MHTHDFLSENMWYNILEIHLKAKAIKKIIFKLVNFFRVSLTNYAMLAIMAHAFLCTPKTWILEQ